MTDLSRPHHAPGSPLTDREIELLALVAAGRHNHEIGAEVHSSVDTIKTHLRRINAKLGARDRAHAVVLAFSHGLLRLAHDGHAVSARRVDLCDCGLPRRDHHDLRCPIWTAETVGPDTCRYATLDTHPPLRSAREQAAERDRAVAKWNRLTPAERAARIDGLTALGA